MTDNNKTNQPLHVPCMRVAKIVTQIREVHIPFGVDTGILAAPVRHPKLGFVNLEMARPYNNKSEKS